MELTTEEADKMQEWAGMDGAIAWHLIDRNADNWNEAGEMMNAWLRANGGGHRVPSEDKNAALLVAIEAKDAALNLWKVASGNAEESELDDMACYCITMPLFCDAYEATEALALSPSTELLEARDRVRDAKLLRIIEQRIQPQDSYQDDYFKAKVHSYNIVNELIKQRESGEWKPELGD